MGDRSHFGIIMGALMWRGFPFPNEDDGFFIGAPLTLATGGGLANPLLEHWGPFYKYPPIYSFLIAAWLKIVGVSGTSVVLLHGLLCWVITWCTVRIFQILGNELLGWMMVVALVIYFASVGLRPDVSGFFFLAISGRLGVVDDIRWKCLSPLFAMLAMATVPSTLAIAGPWLLYLLFAGRAMWVATLCGGVAVIVLNCVLLGGHLKEFWIGFSANAAASNQMQTGWFLTNWYRPMGLIKLTFPLLICFSLIGLSILRRGFRRPDFLAILSVLLGLYVSFNSISGHRIFGVVAILIVGLYIYSGALRSAWSPVVLIGCVALIVGFSLRPMVQGLTMEKPTNCVQLLKEVNALNPSRIVIDTCSLRYVFNYGLRPGMVYLDFGDRPFSKFPHVLRKYPDECWVISAQSVQYCNLTDQGLPVPRSMTLGGKKLGSWITNPAEIALLPPTAPR